MNTKWIKYHILFFLIICTYNYAFNFNIPLGKSIPFNSYFITHAVLLVGYFYCNIWLSGYVIKKISLFIPFQLICMIIFCFPFAGLLHWFYIMEGFNSEFIKAYFWAMFNIASFTFISIGFLFLQKSEDSSEKQIELTTSRSKAELAFLRSQTSPHFLLNTLNSIYSLSLNESLETYQAISELKTIYSYVQSHQHTVPIQEEIIYLENYINIQKRRFGEHLLLKADVHSDKDYTIEPLLLGTFLENAFKHGVSMKEESFITIYLNITEGKLEYTVINSDHSKKSKDRNSGIGIKNLSRRLELLYPNLFSLEYTQKNNIYTARLMLTLV